MTFIISSNYYFININLEITVNKNVNKTIIKQ